MRHRVKRSILLGALAVLLAAGPASGKPLALHPDNPHYFLFRGKPAVLITSGEHYGAVLNGAFDYVPYLDELHARKFNLTRTFSGMYREVPGSFNIVENTLGPRPRDFVCPWPRSDQPGAGDGGNKFDLKAWNPAYFKRLRDFVAQAGKRGIVVELVLFCAIYDDKLWAVNPMRAANNVNGVGGVSRLQVYSLRDKGLQAVQDALVRKIAAELKDFDNVYYEVCNEPYFAGVTREWTDHIVSVIRDAEKDFPGKHLIAQNISNGSQKVEKPNPGVSIFNFHYSSPPESVALNYGLNRVIGFDETGFRGNGDRPYRTDGWDFILAGGAVYSNLDYSYSVSHPGGTLKVTTSPGGGGPQLRKQLQVLKEFIEGFDFVRMRPHNELIEGGEVTAVLEGKVPESRATARVLAEPGKAYAVYLKGGRRAEVRLKLPAGTWKAEWVDTKTGKVAKSEDVDHPGGARKLLSPDYVEDVALRVKRVK